MTAIIREERIGNQRLLLGNCLEIMGELDAVDHVICDPPYEQAMHDLHNKAEFRRTDGGADRQHFSFLGIDETRPKLLDWVESNCAGWFLAFCTAEGVGAWRSSIFGIRDIKFKTTCIWVKPDAAPKFNGQGPAVGYEPFITTWAGKGHAKWNAGGKRGVYTHCVNTNRYGGHPTEKPLPLMMEILKDFTNYGQSILDPFMGSGTTIVACERMGRHGIGIEMNQEYFNLACKRVEEASRQADMFIQPEPKPIQEALF